MLLETATMTDLAAAVKKNPAVIIPFGSVEEHGPHLPLSTDTIQMVEILKIVERKTGVCIAPPVHYGVCRSTENHTGTVGISADTLRALANDLLHGFYRQGFRRIMMISGHAGKLHMIALVEAGERFIKTHSDVRLFVYSELDLIGQDVGEIIETPGDSHAGEIETSRMLWIDERLVRKQYRKLTADKPNFFPGEIVSDKVRYWKSGIWGDPSKATKEKGGKTLDLSARKIIEILKTVCGYSGSSSKAPRGGKERTAKVTKPTTWRT